MSTSRSWKLLEILEETSRFFADRGVPDARLQAELLLADLGTDGNIVVYSSFEKTILTRLQEWFEDLAEPLERIKERLVDLQPIIKNHVWHPEFRAMLRLEQEIAHGCCLLHLAVCPSRINSSRKYTVNLAARRPVVMVSFTVSMFFVNMSIESMCSDMNMFS